jgi:nuclease-like protein
VTASELKRLKRCGWVVRHDIQWGERGNHDHLVVGGSVFVLNSKNLHESAVTVEGTALRIVRVDAPEQSYLADRWVAQVEREARSLKFELSRRARTPVHVYPVIVVWGDYRARQEWVGEVSIVRGDAVVDWIESRPIDLVSPERRACVADAARALPAA